MERKYGEYLAYYKHYRVDLRPDMNEIRKRKVVAENMVSHHTKKQKAIIMAITISITIGIGLTALFTKQWLAVPGAVLFFIAGRVVD